MNKDKAIEFVIKLMDLTNRKKLEWQILGDDPEVTPSKLPLHAKSDDYAYETQIESNHFVLFRCRLPIEEREEITPDGWDEDFTYYLQIFDSNGKFRGRISQSAVNVVLADLYETIQDQLHPIDDIVDAIMSK
ncbi:MAG: hypothetical protein LBQ54_03120 [Planctomycetaceae bacterium]|jgi:hypothetical protein|nr:hypothetical protein [Planctomycetaceae bacterium]